MSTILTAERLRAARAFVGRHVTPTPAYRWPLLEELTGVETWVKHENHTPTGAFKVRGGLWFVEQLLREERPAGLISASRGNHAQSLAYAGRAFDLPVTIVVPGDHDVSCKFANGQTRTTKLTLTSGTTSRYRFFIAE